MRKQSPNERGSGRRSAPVRTGEAGSYVVVERPHQVEQDVQRELLGHPNLNFSSLVVRRIQCGVCLEGVLDAGRNAPDVCALAQSVSGVDEVLNHLVVRECERPPAKG